MPAGNAGGTHARGWRRDSGVLRTRTGIGTVVAEGKEHKDFDGITYILERGIRADLALVRAWKADTHGNLIYRRTARNFNPDAAMMRQGSRWLRRRLLLSRAQLDPDYIHTPGIFVHRLVHNAAAGEED